MITRRLVNIQNQRFGTSVCPIIRNDDINLIGKKLCHLNLECLFTRNNKHSQTFPKNNFNSKFSHHLSDYQGRIVSINNSMEVFCCERKESHLNIIAIIYSMETLKTITNLIICRLYNQAPSTGSYFSRTDKRFQFTRLIQYSANIHKVQTHLTMDAYYPAKYT